MGVLERITKNHYDKEFNKEVLAAANLPPEYIFAEVGMEIGKSSVALLDCIRKTHTGRWLFTIDPHGDKNYMVGNGDPVPFGYDENVYRYAMKNVTDYAFRHKLNHCHFRMTSDDFMDNIDKISMWHDRVPVSYKFGFVYLDGDHNEDVILREFEWFKNRMPQGGCIIIDDYHVLPDPKRLDKAVEKGGRIQELGDHKRIIWKKL